MNTTVNPTPDLEPEPFAPTAPAPPPPPDIFPAESVEPKA